MLLVSITARSGCFCKAAGWNSAVCFYKSGSLSVTSKENEPGRGLFS